MNFTLLPALLVPLLLVGCAKSVPQDPIVMIHPPPGSLSNVVGLEESRLFDVGVNGSDTFVYRGFEEEFDKYGFARKGGHYVTFSFAHTEVAIDITTTQPMKAFSIKPTVERVEQVSDTHLRVELSEPRTFLVTAEFEDSGENWLVVAADPPEEDVPDAGDPSVLYLGPGVHFFGRAWDPFVDGVRTLYLEGGAVVLATLRCVDKEGVSIRGRGLFSQSFRPHARQEDPLQTGWLGDAMGAYFRGGRNLHFEGYAVINAPSYQLGVADCDDVTIRNVKMLGFGENNNDGLHLFSRKVLVEDSFIAGNDDRVCITGLFDSEDREIKTIADEKPRIMGTDVGNIVIRRNVFWGQRNGGDIMLTWNGSHTCSDILIEACASIGRTNKGFLAAMHGGSVVIEDVVIRNIEIYHDMFCHVVVRGAETWGDGGGAIRDVLIEDVSIHAEPGEVKKLMTGWSDTSDISGITFRNITANGTKITGFEQTAIETNEFVRHVHWE